MIVTQLRLLIFVRIVILLLTTIAIVDAGTGRCYLCSQSLLPECAGGSNSNSPFDTSILQYYTEPCNGQCILFRDQNASIIRGCSWTYGHMTIQPNGWHQLSPGIQAYFCDSNLCNGGAYEQLETLRTDREMIRTNLIQSPEQAPAPQELSVSEQNIPSMIDTDKPSPNINTVPRQLRQCYSCTARFTGCGELLDPRYVSQYIRPCASSCVVFRNPIENNLITRDCATTWPQVHAKSGLHKLLGSDAFFCQESLCNGISFDFIMGIFHNQLPAVIKFPLISDIQSPTVPATNPTTTVVTLPVQTRIDAAPPQHHQQEGDEEDETEEEVMVWESSDVDFNAVEATTMTIPIITSTPSFVEEFPEVTEAAYESTTIPFPAFEHFDFVDRDTGSSTIVGGLAVAQQDNELNWWDFNDASFPAFAEYSTVPMKNQLATTTSTLIPPISDLTKFDQEEWSIFDKTSTPPVTRFENLLDTNLDFDLDMNDYFLISTTPAPLTNNIINNNDSLFVPYYFSNYKGKEDVLEFMKPVPTLAMPPFSWMLNLAQQNGSGLKTQKSFSSNISLSSTVKRNRTNSIKSVVSQKLKNDTFEYFNQRCNKKLCQHGGRLNINCSCICLPAYSGEFCQMVNCNREPTHICNFIQSNECKSDYVRHLCPKFCQMNGCSSNQLS